MKLLEAVASILEEAGLGVTGETIFVGAKPVPQGEGLLLSPAPTSRESDDFEDLRRQNFQVSVRAISYPDGYAKCESAYHALWLDHVYVRGLYIPVCRPIGEPFSLGREESDLWTVAVNFSARWMYK